MLGVAEKRPSNFGGLAELICKVLGKTLEEILSLSPSEDPPSAERVELHFRFVDDRMLDHRFIFCNNNMWVSPIRSGSQQERDCIYTAWEPYFDFLRCRRSKEQLFMDGEWRFYHDRIGTFDFFEISSGIRELEKHLPILATIDAERAIEKLAAVSSKAGRYLRVEREPLLRREDFVTRYASVGRPVILTDSLAKWPNREFTFEFLLKVYEDRSFLHDTGVGTIFSFPVNDYIERVSRNDSVPQRLSIPLTREFLRHYRYPQYFNEGSFFHKAQFLFVAPEDASRKRGYGNATSWHCDLADNFLVELIGRKKIRLAPPDNADCFYLAKSEPRHDNVGFLHSPIDPKEPDLNKYPRFADATITECILEPGESLFIPCGWFHSVDNLTPSVAVNCWKIFPFSEVAPELGACCESVSDLGRAKE